MLVDDPFDFRPYLNALLRRWWLLLGGSLLAGLIVFALSFLLPPTYRANALVLVVDPRQLVQFDPRFETVNDDRPLQAYPELALSDSILQTLLAEIGPQVTEPKTREELRELLSVSAGNDPSLLRLTVHHRDAETAALIANRWAEIFVTQINNVLGDQTSEQVAFYQEQRSQARNNLVMAEQSLADFQAINRTAIISATLQTLETSVASYVAAQEEIKLLQQDITALRQQLAAQDGALLPAEQLAVLLLYTRAFNGRATSLPLELQLDSLTTPDVGRAQLIATLDALLETLDATAAELAGQVESLEPQILQLQQERQALVAEEVRLRQEANLAMEAYTALARRATEEEITSQDTSRGLRLASPAIEPEQPVAPIALLNGLLAAVFVFAALLIAILFQQWWRS